jgi:hypothetical protein
MQNNMKLMRNTRNQIYIQELQGPGFITAAGRALKF